MVEIFYCCKIISSKIVTLEKYSSNFFSKIFVLTNNFLKGINLGQIFIKIFDRTFFTGICFSLEILLQIHNTKHYFPLISLISFDQNFLLLQNHFLNFNQNFFLQKFLLEYASLPKYCSKIVILSKLFHYFHS